MRRLIQNRVTQATHHHEADCAAADADDGAGTVMHAPHAPRSCARLAGRMHPTGAAWAPVAGSLANVALCAPRRLAGARSLLQSAEKPFSARHPLPRPADVLAAPRHAADHTTPVAPARALPHAHA